MLRRNARRILESSRRVGRRLADPIPIAPLGVAVAGACALGLERLAYPQMDVVLLVVGWVGLALVALAVLLVSAVALWLKLHLGRTARPAATVRGEPPGLDSLRVETGRAERTGFSLPSLRWLPLVQLRWGWERPEGVRVVTTRVRGRLFEEVTFEGRAEVHGVQRRLVVADAFGLARIALRHEDPLAVQAMPAAGGLRSMPVLSSLAGGDELPHPMGLADGDRVELRRYVPGDPARFIHWKVFGRTRQLMVRVPERALTRSRRTAAYLVAGVDDEASAAVARVAIAGGSLGVEWVFTADGARAETSSAPEALRQVACSSSARSRGGLGLPAFVERVERTGPASLVLFVPPVPGPWLEPVLAVARRRRHGLRVVIGVDGLDTGRRASWLRRLITTGRGPKGSSRALLDEVARKLSARRCEVSIFDRPSGRRLSDAHRRVRAAHGPLRSAA